MNTEKDLTGSSLDGKDLIELENGHHLVPAKVSRKTKNRMVDEMTSSTNNQDRLASDFDQKDFLRVLMEVRNGNFNVRMPIDQVGLNGKICDTLNEIISMNERMV